MPWKEMEILDVRVREKAIDIANALMDEGYEEDQALSLATATVQQWVERPDLADRRHSSDRQLHVVPHPDGWAVRRANTEQACFVSNSKVKAQTRALEMAHDESVSVIVHDQDGQIERSLSPR